MNSKTFALITTVLILSFVSCKPEYKRINFTEIRSLIEVVNGESSVTAKNDIIMHEEPSKFLIRTNPLNSFSLNMKIMMEENAMGLVHIHTDETMKKGYKICLNNDYKKVKHPMTGSILHIRNTFYPFIEDGEWFNMRITVSGNLVEVFINEYPITKYIEPKRPLRNNKTLLYLLSEGFIGIEKTSNRGKINMKDIHINIPLKKATKIIGITDESPVTALHQKDFPVINFHVHLKGGMTIDEAVTISANSGIDFGIAANCGLKFPIENDMGIYEYIEDVKAYPVFAAMQAEGREWVNLFSEEARSEFDYVFTDAMTWTNNKGQRMRLWIPEETFIYDSIEFMQQLTAQIEEILTEPINVYVNPTYLPEQLAPYYDELWTEERIDRVIQALVDNNVALEINTRLNWPTIPILKKAKNAGVKFSFGTNNKTNDIGSIEYYLEVIDSLHLKKEDLWMPDM